VCRFCLLLVSAMIALPLSPLTYFSPIQFASPLFYAAKTGLVWFNLGPPRSLEKSTDGKLD
jgi:hypothetical protein